MSGAPVPKKRKTEPPRTTGQPSKKQGSPMLKPMQPLEARSPPPRGEFVVMKFGGSSVGKRLPAVIQLIQQTAADQPGRLAVVVSAMGDTTDWLLDAADYAAVGDQEAADLLVDRISDLVTTNAITCCHQCSADRPDFVRLVREFLAPLRQVARCSRGPSWSQVLLGVSIVHQKTAQVQDYVLSFGERLSGFVVTQVLNAHGTSAEYVDARRWVQTDDCFGAAQIDFKNVVSLAHEWPVDTVTIHTGFCGSTADGRTTTIGRNGSDYTATVLGAALGASKVVINTDVDGVYTADPRIVASAYPVERMSYYEAIQLAMYGTSLFHPRTFLPLVQSKVPMLIRNTLRPESGTLIGSGEREVDANPACISSLKELVLLELVGLSTSTQYSIPARAARLLHQNAVLVHLSTQASQGQVLAFVIGQAQQQLALELLNQEFQPELSSGEIRPIKLVEQAALVSVVMDGLAGVLARVVSTCSQAGRPAPPG